MRALFALVVVLLVAAAAGNCRAMVISGNPDSDALFDLAKQQSAVFRIGGHNQLVIDRHGVQIGPGGNASTAPLVVREVAGDPVSGLLALSALERIDLVINGTTVGYIDADGVHGCTDCSGGGGGNGTSGPLIQADQINTYTDNETMITFPDVYSVSFNGKDVGDVGHFGADSAEVDNDLEVGGNLEIGGGVLAQNGITAYGGIETDSLTVNGNTETISLTTTGDVTVGGDLDISSGALNVTELQVSTISPRRPDVASPTIVVSGATVFNVERVDIPGALAFYVNNGAAGGSQVGIGDGCRLRLPVDEQQLDSVAGSARTITNQVLRFQQSWNVYNVELTALTAAAATATGTIGFSLPFVYCPTVTTVSTTALVTANTALVQGLATITATDGSSNCTLTLTTSLAGGTFTSGQNAGWPRQMISWPMGL